MCHNCDEASHLAIFEACHCSCAYAELLASVPERQGIALEAINSRRSLSDMLANLRRWASAADVLHLTVEHLREDFNRSMRCLLRFLGPRGAPLVAAARGLDPALPQNRGDEHIARGPRNASGLGRVLLAHPVWGPQLVAARRAYAAVAEHQRLRYGCPTGGPR